MRAPVSGYGIAGLATARLRAVRGGEVLVVERMPVLREDGYLIDVVGSE